MRLVRIGAVAVAVAAGTAAVAQDARQGAPANPPQGGYLAAGEFDVSKVIEPAPRKGDPRYETDRRIFLATRKLKGTPRWDLATNDANYGVPFLLHDFSCSVGVQLTPENAPKLMAVMKRAGWDTSHQSGAAKEMFQRQRPFMIDNRQICEPRTDLYDTAKKRMSYDYPSGHATWGWTWAMVLSALDPAHGQTILDRGRSYADSRFVCGAHNESAVEAGMLSASATMTMVSTKPAYQADLAAARTELKALQAGGAPAATGCEAEGLLVAQRVMPKLDAQKR